MVKYFDDLINDDTSSNYIYIYIYIYIAFFGLAIVTQIFDITVFFFK